MIAFTRKDCVEDKIFVIGGLSVGYLFCNWSLPEAVDRTTLFSPTQADQRPPVRRLFQIAADNTWGCRPKPRRAEAARPRLFPPKSPRGLLPSRPPGEAGGDIWHILFPSEENNHPQILIPSGTFLVSLAIAPACFFVVAPAVHFLSPRSILVHPICATFFGAFVGVLSIYLWHLVTIVRRPYLPDFTADANPMFYSLALLVGAVGGLVGSLYARRKKA